MRSGLCPPRDQLGAGERRELRGLKLGGAAELAHA